MRSCGKQNTESIQFDCAGRSNMFAAYFMWWWPSLVVCSLALSFLTHRKNLPRQRTQPAIQPHFEQTYRPDRSTSRQCGRVSSGHHHSTSSSVLCVCVSGNLLHKSISYYPSLFGTKEDMLCLFPQIAGHPAGEERPKHWMGVGIDDGAHYSV